MADTTELTYLLLAAAVFIATLVIFLYIFRRFRQRQREIAGEVTPSRIVREDRAYNQISLARAAADRLEHQGHDVSRPRDLIAQADAAHARRDPDQALGLARSAMSSLTTIQALAVPSARSTVGATPTPSPAPAVRPIVAPMPAPASPPPAPSRLPPNKAESRFQINLLREELQRGQGSMAPDVAKEAQRFADDAESSYGRADYTEALRQALKGRRRVGGRLETLAPTPATHAESPAEEGGPARDVTAESDLPRCTRCGFPLRAADRFCRGCGASRESPRCAQCGAELTTDDRFCGSCGAPIPGRAAVG